MIRDRVIVSIGVAADVLAGKIAVQAQRQHDEI
jgi:hypothetical protein